MGAGAGALGGAAVGAAIGGPPGALIGGAIGAAGGAIAGEAAEGDDEAGAGAGGAAGSVAGAVIGGAIAGPPGAVVGGAVGAGAGAGVGDQAEEESEETTPGSRRGPHRSLNLRRTKGRLAALRDNSPADARAAGLFHARIALLDPAPAGHGGLSHAEDGCPVTRSTSSSGWAKRSIRRRSAGRAHRSTGCSGWAPGAPGCGLTTAAFRAQRSSLRAPAPSFESAAFEATDQVADGPRPGWIGSRPARSSNPVAGPLRESLDRLAAELGVAGVSDPRFAVRSSAIGEDGSVASYAGLHETELDLSPGRSGAVARCWASLWSPAAIAYRRRRGQANDVAMAVVVQGLVPGRGRRGLPRHPVTGREDQVVITAVRGLGDAMVAGTVTPDTYVVDKASRSTIGFEPGEDPAGPALDAADLAAVVDVALAVESGFGAPVDIEAAQSAGHLVPAPRPAQSRLWQRHERRTRAARNRAGRSSGATSSRSPSTIPPRPRSPGSATTCTRRLR